MEFKCNVIAMYYTTRSRVDKYGRKAIQYLSVITDLESNNQSNFLSSYL